MAVSLDSASPVQINKDLTISMDSSSLLSPSSEKRFWSALRSRVDTLLDNRKGKTPVGSIIPNLVNISSPVPAGFGELESGKCLREDSLLLLRGFDSIASSLSHLTSNLDTALQGARDLAKPSLTELLYSNPEKTEDEDEDEAQEQEGNKKRVKRKSDSHESSDVQDENEESPKRGKMKKARNLAVSMATKAASLARELKSIKSDLCYMQERCTLLEEENKRLREGFGKGERPEEDDLVRLQLEALLAEKSRLAYENANLTRENQCLHQLVEYHQLTSQDLSASYEQVIRGMCLDFSSPPIAEEANTGDGSSDGDTHVSQTPRTDIFGLSTSLDEYFYQEQ